MLILISVIMFCAGALMFALSYARLLRWKRRISRSKEIQKFYTSDESQVELCYTDEFGNNWYQWTNPTQIPALRTISIESATAQHELCITWAELVRALGEMKKMANKGQIVELFSVLNALEERLSWATEESTLTALASCYFLLEGEPHEGLLPVWDQQKREIWNNSVQTRNFFFIAAYKLTKSYSELSETDIPVYLARKKAESVGLFRSKKQFMRPSMNS